MASVVIKTAQYSDPGDLSHDRLGFTFCLALALHAAFILGISFNQIDRSTASKKIEITLAQHSQTEVPEDVDFLAQHNQQGSGTLEEKALLTTREQADFIENTIREVHQQQLQASQQQEADAALVTTTTDTRIKTPSKRTTKDEKQANEFAGDMTILQRSKEIASLEARLDIQEQAFAKRPRVKRLTSVATKKSMDARYLDNWRSKIESIGNKNYPSAARQNNIYGDLRLMVSLLPNGDIHRVKILQSSGYKVLDQAAIRIVHLAAPYDPFPIAMQRETDILQIIRTWRFQRDGLTSNS